MSTMSNAGVGLAGALVAAVGTALVVASRAKQTTPSGPGTDLFEDPTTQAKTEEQLRELVTSKVGTHVDFPKPGITFYDVFPVFQDARASRALAALIYRHVRSTHGRVDVVVGLDARGFLLGPVLAMRLGCSFVPVRKPGKLPGAVLSAAYTKEYGTDGLEMQYSAVRKGDLVVVVDDLMASYDIPVPRAK